MKLLPLLLILCLDCGAQNVVTAKAESRYESIDFITKSPGTIQLITELRGKKDTSVFIQGDTMTLIKNLLIDYFKQTLLLDSLRKSRAVIFDAEGKLTVVEYRNIWHWVKAHTPTQ